MVTLAGAIAAQPYIAQLQNLNKAVADLAAAISANSTVAQIMLQVLDSQQNSSMVTISYPFNVADSNAIFWDIKNIIANDVNIQTNALGVIT
jgi:hypothetical protein